MLSAALAACSVPGPQLPPVAATPSRPVPPSASPTAAAPPSQAPEILPGTGAMVKSPPVRHAATATNGDITLNFVDADVRDIAAAVLGDIMGARFSVDPDVQATATLQTRQPISRSAVIPTLSRALSTVGIAVVAVDGGYRLSATERAMRGPVAVSSSRNAQGFRIQIIPMRYTSAAEMAKILQPISTGESSVQVDAERNLLVVTGSDGQIQSVLDMVEAFDVDWLAGMSFAMLPLDYADAKTVVADLERIFGEKGQITPMSGVLRFVPIQRLNAVLVISPQPMYLDRAAEWVKRLDSVGGEGGARLFVYQVKHGKATDLAKVISEVFGAERGHGERDAEVAPGLEPVEVHSSDISRTEPPVPGLGSSAPEQPDQTDQVEQARSVSLSGAASVRIIGDESRNAVLVYGRPADYRIIEQALAKLDVLPLQVLIEATIAEVNLNDDLRYGVRGFFEDGKHAITLSDAAGAVAPLPGFSYVFTSGNDKLVLDALDRVTDVKVVSSPHLMVLNNQTGTLQVGDQVPVATESAVSVNDPNSPIVNSIRMLDTGIVLKVTPRVNPGGLVILDVEQEFSIPVETTTSNLNSPTIQQRRITSTVAIQGNETVALGGLIRDSYTKSRDGIPVLSRIPVLGAAFSSTGHKQDRTELLVLITPRLIENTQQARDITDELRIRMKSLLPPQHNLLP
jgi:general secretion pathway protein D